MNRPRPPRAQALETYFSDLLTPPADASAADRAPGYLVFRLARLDFALPVARVDAVLPLPGALSPPAPGWLGRLCHDGRPIDIADTAAHVLPAAHRATGEAALHVIVLAGTTLGLSCDAVVEDCHRFDPSQVRWSGSATSRPWLAGTLAARRCALIEPDGLLRVLDRTRPEQLKRMNGHE